MGLIKMYARPIKYKVNGPGTEETADGFVASPVRYSTISVEDLADHISADSRVERSKVAVITDSLIKQIREMVLNGHKIIIPHLGSFKPKIKSNLAINPESVDAASFTAKVQFTPSVELKRDLQASRIEKTTLPTAPENPSIDAQKTAILADFKKQALKLIAEKTAQPIADLPAAVVKLGWVDLGTPTLAVACKVKLDNRDYFVTKAVKARYEGGMGRSYDWVNASQGRIFNSEDFQHFEGWNTTGWQEGDDYSTNSLDGFYKVTEPFAADYELSSSME